jgi:thiol-disulfide isomerase/thioredoxin
MRFFCLFSFIFGFSICKADAQTKESSLLNLGDPAPRLYVQEWVKGTPIQQFEKGHIYVLEFWATWCGPCIKAMPHLSSLALEYKDKVTIIGVDVLEKQSTTLSQIKAFVDSMGQNMDYHVAKEDSNFMEVGWLDAAQQQGIPVSYVIDKEGRLAWIGHPTELPEVLHNVVNNTWDIKQALAIRNENKRLTELEFSVRDSLNTLTRNNAKPESILSFIEDILGKEPKLQYMATIVFYKFSSLLKANASKAYQYGKEVITLPQYESQSYQFLVDVIQANRDKIIIPKEIYDLGAETFQARISRYSENINNAYAYKGMAEMYWDAKNKHKAIEALQKAIDALKSEGRFSKEELVKYHLKLQEYKNLK